MSIASLGIVGGFAGAGLTQRTAEADRLPRDAAEQARAAEATERAENAAGIGQTEEDSQTNERDADGRRLWERSGPSDTKGSETSPVSPVLAQSKDPTGDCGSQLDLTG